ncbi:MAG: hypothetical protein JWP12_302 [Bacteroidetes bacterium]|nr:hypothetical protein [Bacteroidota bacterium]
MNKLETTQRWLTSIIIRPGRLHDKISAADKTYQLDTEKMIRTSATLSPENRISVYARGYVLRLMECMRADYPVLLHLLGEELFNSFVQAYLVNVPSHSPSLYDLGENFPAFLKASQPQQNEDAEMFDLPVELAQVERTRVEVERSKGLETEQTANSDDSLFHFLGTSNYNVSPCLRLLQLQYELLDFIKAVERGKEAETPERKINYLAISRKNYAVNLQQLEAWQFYYLKALAITGDHNAAVKIAATESGIPEESIMADLLLWIPVAMEYGYVFLDDRF